MEKIKRIPAREQIVTQLKSAILSGQIAAGSELIQEKLAELLGVSRMPVREAFHILERDGYLTLHNTRKAIVLAFTMDDIVEHYELRALLEASAAVEAARSSLDVSGLSDLVRRMEDASDVVEFIELNEQFHHSIWMVAKGRKRVEILMSLWDRIPSRLPTSSKQQQLQSNAEHRQIVNALLESNGELAALYMKEHILRAMREYVGSPSSL